MPFSDAYTRSLMMHLLIDSDVFCKLEICGLMDEAIRIIGFSRENCRRLQALHYMLRKGTIFKKYGAQTCSSLMPSVMSVEAAPNADPEVLEKMSGLPMVNPGEAQLVALAVSSGDYVLTGDKNSLRALKDLAEVTHAVNGRIVILETLLLAMCVVHGSEWLRGRIQPLRLHDRVVEVCFTDATTDPSTALKSYVDSAKAELAPMVLWEYGAGGTT